MLWVRRLDTLNAQPLVSPDGGRIVFSARQKASIDLHVKASNGVGSEDVLLEA